MLCLNPRTCLRDPKVPSEMTGVSFVQWCPKRASLFLQATSKVAKLESCQAWPCPALLPRHGVRELRSCKSGFLLRLLEKVRETLIGLTLRERPFDRLPGQRPHGRGGDGRRRVVPQRGVVEGDVERRNPGFRFRKIGRRDRFGFGETEKIGKVGNFWNGDDVLGGIWEQAGAGFQ